MHDNLRYVKLEDGRLGGVGSAAARNAGSLPRIGRHAPDEVVPLRSGCGGSGPDGGSRRGRREVSPGGARELRRDDQYLTRLKTS